MNTTMKAAGIAAVALAGYDTLVRPRMVNWGASSDERRMQLPGDDIASGMPPDYTKAVTIQAPPEAVWPWLAQVGDHRAGFYSYDWVERFLFLGTVHYIEGTHSATRVHPELQQVHVGDRINTGTVGKIAVGNPVTVLEPGRALVIGTWAFILQPLPGGRTRLLVRNRDWGYLRAAAPRRLALLRTALSVIDYLIGDPLHFAMERKMMLGLKQRAESAAIPRGPAASAAEDARHPASSRQSPEPGPRRSLSRRLTARSTPQRRASERGRKEARGDDQCGWKYHRTLADERDRAGEHDLQEEVIPRDYREQDVGRTASASRWATAASARRAHRQR